MTGCLTRTAISRAVRRVKFRPILKYQEFILQPEKFSHLTPCVYFNLLSFRFFPSESESNVKCNAHGYLGGL